MSCLKLNRIEAARQGQIARRCHAGCRTRQHGTDRANTLPVCLRMMLHAVAHPR